MIIELNAEDYSALKVDTVERICALRDDATLWTAVDKTDALVGGTRLRRYITGCIDNPAGHNLYELLAIPRFARFVHQYVYLPEMVARVVRFIEALPQPSASGRVFVLISEVQLFQYASIYGFFTSVGKRLTREVLLFVPRKFGKTTTAAGVSLYDLLFGDADAEVYITANSLDQSGICFGMVRKIVKLLDKKKQYFRDVSKVIELHMPGREGKVASLAANAQTLDGLKASINVNDESSQAVSFATKFAVTTSMGTRKNPLTIDLTTASDLVDSPFVDQLNDFKKILRGEDMNDTVFAHIFQPDLGDDESSPDVWRKVNPHIGVTVDVDYYAAEYRKSQRSLENAIAFRTKLLNVFVCGASRTWITEDEIRALFRENINLDRLNIQEAMRYATCSFDLSIRDDFSAVTYMVYLSEENAFYSRTDYYIPRATVERHSNRELYRKWVDDGHLIAIDGDTIDYSVIVQDILRRNTQVAISAIGYDAYRSGEAVTSLRNSGAAGVLKAVPQTRSAFTSPTDIMELCVSRKKIFFHPNPITPWCFANAVIDEDNNKNRKPMKRYNDSPMKIDGVITNLMCLKLWNDLDVQVN